jgi:hypothetical protein
MGGTLEFGNEAGVQRVRVKLPEKPGAVYITP